MRSASQFIWVPLVFTLSTKELIYPALINGFLKYVITGQNKNNVNKAATVILPFTQFPDIISNNSYNLIVSSLQTEAKRKNKYE